MQGGAGRVAFGDAAQGFQGQGGVAQGYAVVGVQAEGASAVARTWQPGQWTTTAEAATWAEGLATRVPATMTMAIMRELLDDVMLVGDDTLRLAVYQLLEQTHNLAEGAGAAARNPG